MSIPEVDKAPSDIRQEDVREEIHRVLTRYFYTGEPGEHDAIVTATDVLAALYAQTGEPVAWRWRTQSLDNWTFSHKRFSMNDIGRTATEFAEQPLYASPPPQPDTAPSPLSTGEELVDSIAKWLHEETEHPDSYPHRTWPETDRDDGRREGGWVKIVPQHAQAYFRDIARRLIATFPAALSQPPATEQIRREVMSDVEIAAWGRDWHWADTAENKPTDPSIYFRDTRMLKAFARALAATEQER